MTSSEKPAWVPGLPWNEQLGNSLRWKREQLGWSQAMLAARAGTNQQTVDRLERGKTRSSKAIIPLLDALGLNRSLLTFAEFLSMKEGTEAPPPNLRNPETAKLAVEKEFPIFAQDKLQNGSFARSAQAYMYWQTPAPLLYVRSSYGLLIAETDMIPAYRPGDVALVHPWMMPRPGLDVVVTDVEKECMVRTLSAMSETTYTFTSWAPEKRIQEVPREQLRTCDPIVGKFSVY